MLRALRSWTLVPLLAFAAVRAPAGTSPEAGLPLIQSFGVRDYNELAQNWSVNQDAAGVLYVGNDNGVVLTYDGHEWGSIKVGGSGVRGLVFDEAGRLWFGSIGDLGYLTADGKGGHICTSLRDRLPAEVRDDLIMYHVVGRPDGIFFFTRNHVLRWHDGKFDVEKIRYAWPSQPGGRLLRHGVNRPLEEWQDGAWRPLADLPELRRYIVRFAAERPDGSLLLATNRGGFFLLADGQLTPWPTEIDAMARDVGIERGLLLRDGSMALSHRPQGFSIIDGQGGLRHYFSDKNSSLVSPIAWAFFQDRQDDLWVMLDVGLARIDRPGGPTFFGQTGGTRRVNATATCVFRGRHYLSTTDGLLRLVPGESGTVPPRQARFEKVPGIDRNIRSLAATPDELLIGCPEGLVVWRDDGSPPQSLFPGVYIWLLWASPLDPTQALLGTPEGVLRITRGPEGWQRAGKLRGIDTEVSGFDVDADGSLWLATLNRGFYRLIGLPGTASADGDPIRIEHYPGGHGLPTEKFITQTTVANVDGRTRFLDAGRMFHFDPEARRFVGDYDIGARLGVPGAEIVQLLDDRRGHFWAFTRRQDAAGWPARGLQAFGLTETGAIQTLPHRVVDYIGANPMLQLLPSADGGQALWIAGTDGIARVELPEGVSPQASFRTLLRSATDAGGTPLPLDQISPLTYARRNLELVAATDRLGETLMRYQTRLDGQEWSEWVAQPRHSFARLPAGRHVMQIRARDSDGNLAEPVAFTVLILAPWWQTWWAYGLYGLMAAGIMILLVRWRGRALRLHNEELARLVADRTAELVEAKSAAEAGSQAKSVFLASMSHELRTPLNAILGFAQILRRSPGLSDEQRERLAVIGRNGDHLLQMINEVLDLSKIEAGKLSLAPHPTDLPRLVQGLADTFGGRAADKGLAFHRELSADLPPGVSVDEVKLRQVLINLLGNALKFTDRGHITFRVRPEADGVLHFEVADTGIGIPAAEQERIFEPFHQSAALFARQGTGLGLAISQQIVRLMGGTLRVDSRPGTGSRFSFKISPPAAKPARPRNAGGAITGYSGQRRRLLVVDDEPANRDVLRALLEPLGFAIEECADGRTCLAAFTRQPADAVLLDLRMPGELDGYATARALRRLPGGGSPAIIAVSASVFEEDRQAALDAGCDAFVPKPFSEENLFGALGDCLDLQWILQEPATQSPAAVLPALPAGVVEQLRDLARRGDIMVFRECIQALEAAHPDCAATLAHLDSLAAGFQLGRLRQELRTSRTAPSSPPL